MTIAIIYIFQYRTFTIHVFALVGQGVVDPDLLAEELRNLTTDEMLRISNAGFDISYEVGCRCIP